VVEGVDRIRRRDLDVKAVAGGLVEDGKLHLLDRLQLNDAAMAYEPETSGATNRSSLSMRPARKNADASVGAPG